MTAQENDARIARLEEKGDHTHDLVKDIHRTLVGAPGNDGLVTRVSKVEAKQAVYGRVSWASFVAFLGLVVAFFKSKL